ncbi:MAG: 6,7-dimethyl-8-ribityllumazine synthase [Nitrososphaeraceae archaeon]
MNLAIVVSEFNYNVTSRMLEAAKCQAMKLDICVKYVCYVPGVFDMPLILDNLLQKKDIDAIVAIGAVIKGDTNHDNIIAENTARLIIDLSLKYGIPISLGITGPNMTIEQALAREKIVPIRAINSAYNMTMRLKQLKNISNQNSDDNSSNIIIK